MASLLRIIEPGASATVQDLGRFGHAGVGVSECGAADRLSLRIANRLVGNPDGCAAIEGTLVGPTIEVEAGAGAGDRSKLGTGDGSRAGARNSSVRLALTGGSVDAVIETPTGRRPAPMWRAIELPVGSRLVLGPVGRGCRVYVAAAGGIDTPMTLGSRSVHRATGIGGHGLGAGDAVPIGKPGRSGGDEAFDDAERAGLLDLIRSLWSETLRVTSVPDAAMGVADASAVDAAWHEGVFRVERDSDRVGIRLGRNGEPVAASDAESPSEPTMYGSIQATPEQLIVLGPDAAPTGGYPTIAHVIAADLDGLGQKRPGDVIRFARVSRDEAWRRWREREQLLEALLPRVGSDGKDRA